MAGAIDQIERDLALLAQSLEAIAQEFQTLYRHYLTDLGKATRQQLVMTSFHVCTQGYPERFLRLSLNRRQKLQQGLRQLADQAQLQLSQLLETSAAIAAVAQLDLENHQSHNDEPTDRTEGGSGLGADRDSAGDSSGAIEPPSNPTISQFLKSQPLIVVPLTDSEQPQFDPAHYLLRDDSVTLDLSMPEPSAPPDSNAESSRAVASSVASSNDESAVSPPSISADAESSNDMNDGADGAENPEASSEEGDRPFEPALLLDQQDMIEENIAEILRTISHAANRLIQQSGVLPKKLPETVLEAAAKADLSTEAAGPPNLLNLIVETGGDDNDDHSRITYIMAIRLRVSEIEFSNPALSAWRAKLREFSARLNRLDQDFEKKQRERAVAEAESVWRSSWYDE